VVARIVGLRASAEVDSVGIDVVEHAEHAYVHDTLIGASGERFRPVSRPVAVGE
jgi:hypothetical protein